MRPLILPLLILAACSGNDSPKTNRPEPDYITVDHILIAYHGAPRIKGVTRSLAEAKELAYDLLTRVENGDDWASLKKKYSNDPGPTGEGGGPYPMSNTGALRQQGVTPRDGMVPAFGNVGFQLEVGEIRIADQDPAKSPYGYHIINRVK